MLKKKKKYTKPTLSTKVPVKTKTWGDVDPLGGSGDPTPCCGNG